MGWWCHVTRMGWFVYVIKYMGWNERLSYKFLLMIISHWFSTVKSLHHEIPWLLKNMIVLMCYIRALWWSKNSQWTVTSCVFVLTTMWSVGGFGWSASSLIDTIYNSINHYSFTINVSKIPANFRNFSASK